MPQIVPFLWFDGQAEEAASFYVSLFPNSRIGKISRAGENMPQPAGSVLTVEFELDGKPYLAMNGGPGHPFTDAVSLQILVDSQDELDRYWDGLISGGGAPVACGWLKDRYGFAWQVTPTMLMTLIADPDPAKANRAFQAMMKMVKLDIAALEAAAQA
jgi:predicted 3-demethylubiquinone-9 3-methyltransferase (glyoxalase superfamily)